MPRTKWPREDGAKATSHAVSPAQALALDLFVQACIGFWEGEAGGTAGINEATTQDLAGVPTEMTFTRIC
jgi:hypothetical protein